MSANIHINLTGWQQTFTNLTYRLTTNLHIELILVVSKSSWRTNLTGWQQTKKIIKLSGNLQKNYFNRLTANPHKELNYIYNRGLSAKCPNFNQPIWNEINMNAFKLNGTVVITKSILHKFVHYCKQKIYGAPYN